jgi:hypothetical protein
MDARQEASLGRAAALLAYRGGEDRLIAFMSLLKHAPTSIFVAQDEHAAAARRLLAAAVPAEWLRFPRKMSSTHDANEAATHLGLMQARIAHQVAARLSHCDALVARGFRKFCRQLCATVVACCIAMDREHRLSPSEANDELLLLLGDSIETLRSIVRTARCDVGDAPPDHIMRACFHVLSICQSAALPPQRAELKTAALDVIESVLARWQEWRRRVRVPAGTPHGSGDAHESDASYSRRMHAVFAGLLDGGRAGPMCRASVEVLVDLFAQPSTGAGCGAAQSLAAKAGDVLLRLLQQAPERSGDASSGAHALRFKARCAAALRDTLLRSLAAVEEEPTPVGEDGAAVQHLRMRHVSLQLLLCLLQRHRLDWLTACAAVPAPEHTPLPAADAAGGSSARPQATPVGFLALCCNLVSVVIKSCADSADTWLLQDSSVGGIAATVAPSGIVSRATATSGAPPAGSKVMSVTAMTRRERNAALLAGYDRSSQDLLAALSVFQELCRFVPSLADADDGKAVSTAAERAGGAWPGSMAVGLTAEVYMKLLQSLQDGYTAVASFLQAAASSPVRPSLEALAAASCSSQSLSEALASGAGPSAADAASTRSDATVQRPPQAEEEASLPLRAVLTAPLLLPALHACLCFLKEVDEVWSADPAAQQAAAEADDGGAGLPPGDEADAGLTPQRRSGALGSTALIARPGGPAGPTPTVPEAAVAEMHVPELLTLAAHGTLPMQMLLPALPLFLALQDAACGASASPGRPGAAASANAPYEGAPLLLADAVAALSLRTGVCPTHAHPTQAFLALRVACDPLTALLRLYSLLAHTALQLAPASDDLDTRSATSGGAPSGPDVKVNVPALWSDLTSFLLDGSGVFKALQAQLPPLVRKACLSFMNAVAAGDRCGHVASTAGDVGKAGLSAAAIGAVEQLRAGVRDGLFLFSDAAAFLRDFAGVLSALQRSSSDGLDLDVSRGERSHQPSLGQRTAALRAAAAPLVVAVASQCTLVADRGVRACERLAGQPTGATLDSERVPARSRGEAEDESSPLAILLECLRGVAQDARRAQEYVAV